MLSVRDLVGAMELELAAGERAAGAPIRWVHVSELADPTPWLSGGELLLSTGMALGDEESQRAYVHRLARHQLAGLGFGVGFGFDVLGLVLSGRADGEEIAARLAPFQVTGEAAVLLLAVEGPDELEGELDRALAELGAHALVATVDTPRRRLLCAVLAAADGSPAELAATARERLASGGREVRAAVSHVAPVAMLRRSFHEARCALEIGGLANGSASAVATADDLGAYRLLLSLQDDDGLRQYCDDVLRPIERARGGNGEELLRSLEAFLEHHGNWEAAARALFCHRHTLRYRMSRVEELTGRRMDRVENRIEFWLALRGRELVGDPQPTHH